MINQHPKWGVLFSIFTICSALAACSTTASKTERGMSQFKDDPRLGEEVSSICFKGNIDGFSDAAGNTIVLREGVNRHYRVSLSGFCPNLKHAQSLAFERQSGCARRGDYILVSESVFSLDDGDGFGPDRCFINEIYEWDRDAKDESKQVEDQSGGHSE